MIVKLLPDDLEGYSIFLAESVSTLDNLENKILSLEAEGNTGLVNDLFRDLHSMKGVASCLQLTSIQKLSHKLESIFDSIRKGEAVPGPGLVDDCLRKVDNLNAMVRDLSECLNARKPLADGGWELEIKEWDEAADGAAGETPSGEAAAPELMDPLAAADLRAGFIKQSLELIDELENRFMDLERNPSDWEALRDAFRGIHNFKGACGFLGYADMERLGHRLESALEGHKDSEMPLGTSLLFMALRCLDAFRHGCADVAESGPGRMPAYDELMRQLERAAESPAPGATPLGKILVDQGSVGQEDLERALALQDRPVGRILLDEGKITPAALESALGKQAQESVREAKSRPLGQPAELRKDLRVDLAKLDQLLDLVGELVIASSIVSNHPDLQVIDHEGFDKAAHHMGGIVNDVQKVVLGLRMVPIESVFKKMVRLVHDQSSKCGKQARLELRGEKTEVDKNIAELIADPLVHMIRNAVDHGIEKPEERAAAGKPATGTVILEAKQEGGDICISLSDDGRGLDRDRILRKAVEKGLIKGNPADLKEDEIFQFIFAPGFSTAEQITSTSGRGVGMDVVKNNVEKLKGRIIIRSRPGQGTVVDVRLPLTLSIIEGMQVRVGESQCIIPLTAVKETLSPSPGQVTRIADGEEVFFLRGSLYPILRLNRMYRIPGGKTRLEEGILLLIEARDLKYCLFVDALEGMRQTVVKSLPPFLGNIAGASGCSILANGEICLILDVEALHAGKQESLAPAGEAAAEAPLA